MGACGGKQSDEKPTEKTNTINKQMKMEKKEKEEYLKLLLLGAGESGKSTLFKQMISLYGKGWPESKRVSFRDIIYDNIVSMMQILCIQSSNFGKVSEENKEHKLAIENFKVFKDRDEYTLEVCAHLKALWADEGIQATYAQRSKFQLNDSTGYFMDKVEEISQQGWIPTEHDVLRTRVRTTGIVENEFEIKGNLFNMFDVGGQRNERNKWIHCFEHVTAVLFVVAISAYDQTLIEDNDQNRMVEALTLFDEICNSRWFKNTAVILFMNKRDLFAEKIQTVPLTVCSSFKDYAGDGSYDDTVDYIRKQFCGLNRREGKSIYVHITCATDSTNVGAVFSAVSDIIVKQALAASGLA